MDPHASDIYVDERRPLSAVEVWVKRALREQYRDVAAEPLPDELVALLGTRAR